jgi:hypothetical protein
MKFPPTREQNVETVRRWWLAQKKKKAKPKSKTLADWKRRALKAEKELRQIYASGDLH